MTACVLLELHADVVVADFDQRTTLHKVAACGRHELVDVLLVAGASPKAADRHGTSPIDVAINAGHGFCAEIMRVYRPPFADDTQILSPKLRLDIMRENQSQLPTGFAEKGTMIMSMCAEAVAATSRLPKITARATAAATERRGKPQLPKRKRPRRELI